ncbi:MAG TPA: amidohydrolase family protein, partial [Pirellulaceae bacterium]
SIENSLALMLHQVQLGHCTLGQVVERMSAAPARVWDIVNKGRIQVGYDADLVLVDLNATRTIMDDEQLTKCRWSPWHGITLQGWPVRTWVRGTEVFCDGRVIEARSAAEIQFDHALGGYWSTESP